ncbi:Essential nuclear protein 1 [Spathaspora sp. JA1]|nr:Essential nuclear protein 1 [Spathaspora sp. JA1]
MGKISVGDTKGKQRHNPLLKDISSQGGNLRTTPRPVKSTKKPEQEGYLDAVTSRKILQLAKEQQDELREEEEQTDTPSFRKQLAESEDESEQEYSDFEEEEEEIEVYEEEIEVDEKDAELFNKYFQSNGQAMGQSINLADKIMAKIQEKEAQQTQARPVDAVMLPPKVIMAYEKIGQILASYTHGKLPKLFKILPSLKNWQDVLYVTNPEKWTPHATYEASKLFVSNLSANESQKFVEQVLLEKFRTSIEDSEDHSLNYHIYRALKKSLYKPAAFFKGFLLPLVDGHCSVREATIAASVLTKVSVPVLHSSVALTQLLQRDFSPATTVFIRVLIEKKYALPYQTLDELVFYFMRFRNAEQMQIDETTAPQLPVVWHKAFLAFAQRYKNDITDDQRDFLLETVRQRFHHAIGPEIRRELLAGKPRLTEQQPKDGLMVDAF